MGKREMGRRQWHCPIWRGEREAPGCMSGMLRFFDAHHFLLATKNGSSRSESAHNSLPQLHHCHSQLKGVEAPRNSLELDEAAAAKASANASALAEEYYGIPLGIQIKSTPSLTKTKKEKKDSQLLAGEVEEENSLQCETPRSPNVIARLMGLEILPDDALTPSLTPKKNRMNKKTSNRKPLQKIDTNPMGSRSLPDTPRASTERTWDSNPRLSLQINKENNNNNNRAMHLSDVSYLLPPSPTSRDHWYNSIQDENNKSPRRSHTREIVKHLKENIDYRRGTGNLADGSAVNRSSGTRKTDKKVLLVENNDLVEFPKPQSPPKAPRPRSTTVRFKVGENIGEKQDNHKKANWERYTERIKRQPPASEIAAQSHVMLPNPSSSACSNLIALPQTNSNEKIRNRDNVSATSTTRREATCRSPLPPSERTWAAFIINPTQKQHRVQYKRAKTDEDPEFLYVRTILERAGIMTNPTKELRWYSPSLPIDPFIYHQLENSNLALRGPLQHRCNRKLLFHLTEEVLGDLSRSTSTSTQKRWLPEINRELLLERLWSQIKSFPLANCQIIEDIDALVAGDMAEAKVRQLLRHPLVVAEAEDIVSEIEDDVVDSIIAEATPSLRKCTRVR